MVFTKKSNSFDFILFIGVFTPTENGGAENAKAKKN